LKLKPTRFLIYGPNYFPELIGIGKYTTDMVNWLTDNGSECVVITAFPYYPYWEVQKPYKNLFYKKEVYHDGKLIIYRCPFYVPKDPNGIRRILHDITFLFSSFWLILFLMFGRTFDYVFTVAPPFHLGLVAMFYRFFKKCKIIYHIQDLQVDAAHKLSLINSGFTIKLLFRIEKFIIRNVDYVSSISDGMIKKIKAKCDRRVLSFPNWTNTDDYYPIVESDKLKLQWGFKTDDYIVLYSGNIGQKQGLENIIEVAEQMAGHSKTKFVICGTGAYKSTLSQMIEEKQLDNVFFFDLQPAEVFNNFLNMADLHLILQKESASDLVMPSKLTNILAAGGLVLVTASKGTSLYNIIADNEIGLLVEPDDTDALLVVIKECYQSKHIDICNNARTYATEVLSLNKIMSKFAKDIDLVESPI